MAFESGGYADKLGNRYEGRWIARQLLYLLNESNTAVCVEAIGDDEVGVDLWVESSEHPRLGQQCKSRNTGKDTWNGSHLHNRGILEKMRTQLDRDLSYEFALVSAIEGKLISDVCQSARDSNGNPEDFYHYQITAIGKDRQTVFNDFCKYLHLDPESTVDRAKAFNYLRRFYLIHVEDDIGGQKELLESAKMLVAGDPDIVVSSLIDFAQRNLRKRITARDVGEFLASKDLHPRQLPHDTRVWPAVMKLQEQFRESIKPGLIRQIIVPRSQTTELIEALSTEELLIVHGRPGSGKSAVLYELIQALDQSGHAYIPLRVDRQMPRRNPVQFGKDVGLPESPSHCLDAIVKSDISVLILDQLDAIRWTSQHSLESLQVCRSLVNEIQCIRRSGKKLSVVIACRTFDLKHDPEIRSWLDADRRRIRKVEVTSFGDDQVKEVCVSHGYKYNLLARKQRDLLRLPHHLAMWVKIVKTGETPIFRTGSELMKTFWTNRLQEVEKMGVSSPEVEQVLERLIDHMERKAVLRAPLTLAENQSSVLEALQSAGLISVTGRQISFGHQSYLDYQIASRLLRKIHSGTADVLAWLGDRANQSLMRREQFRLVLAVLEEESPEEFTATIRQSLQSGAVRFHMKHLILEFLSQLNEPTDAVLAFVGELISDRLWREHVLKAVFAGQPGYVQWGLNKGPIIGWLKGNAPADRDAAHWLLRTVAEKIPDSVAIALEPLANEAERRDHILGSLAWNVEDDSDRMFELRLDLAREGLFKDFVNWGKYSKQHPDRAVRLLAAVISSWERSDLAAYDGHPQRRSRFEQWSKTDLDALLRVAKRKAELAWTLLFPEILRLSEREDENGDASLCRRLAGRRYDKKSVYLENGILAITIAAGRELARQAPSSFFEMTSALRETGSDVIDYIAMKCYSALTGEFANPVIEWLMQDSTRLIAGDGYHEPKWLPARQLVSSLSPKCSHDVFKRLEDFLIHFHDPDEKGSAEFYLKTWKQGFFGDFWGKAQYFLLSALDPAKCQPTTTDLVGVLKRKFRNRPFSSFVMFHEGRGGFIGSPISRERLPEVSDRAWLRDIVGNPAITKDASMRARREHKDRELCESSVFQFSRDLATVAKHYPERFGKLALQFPAEVDPQYVAAILEGLKQTKRPDDFGETRGIWMPAPTALIDAVIKRFLSSDEPSVAREFCSLLQSLPSEEWSTEIRERLVSYAVKHPDPAEDRVVFGNPDGGFDAFKASVSNLTTTALNIVRGKAAFAVGKLLEAHPDWLNFFEPALESLAADPHPSVRIAAVEACLSILNIDSEKALNWFVRACRDDPRVTASHYATFFFNGFIKSHQELLKPLVRRMVESTQPDVQERGAMEVAARNIFYGFFGDELQICLAGTTAHRKGVAQIVSQLILDNRYTAVCREFLSALANDSSPEVLQEIQAAFHDKEIFSVPDANAIIDDYILSKAFAKDPTTLLFAMERYSGSLLPVADLILAICHQFTGPLLESSQSISSGVSADAQMLPPLLLRLYEEAHEKKDFTIVGKCLDAWDLLFEKRVGSVRDLTQALRE